MGSWLAFKAFMLKVWLWCKRYWQLLAGAAIPLIIWFIFRSRDKSDSSDTPAVSDVVNRINTDHRQEIAAIDESVKIERERIAAATPRRDETVAQIVSEYDAAKVELDEKKKKEIGRLVKRHGDDPDALTQELAKLTGAHVWTGGNR